MSDLARFRSARVGAWSAEIWDGLIEAIGARFAPLEEQLGIQREVAESIIQRGLAVIEAELAPLVEQGGSVYDQIVDIKQDALAAYAIIQGMVDAGIPIAQVTGLQTALDAKATPGDITAAIDALKGGASAAFDTLIEMQTAFGEDPDFAASVATQLAGLAAKDGSNIEAPPTFRANIAAASLLDTRRNRIVNGCVQHSQQNGNAQGTLSGYFAADQWSSNVSHDGTSPFERVELTTPAGARHRLRVTVSVADTSLTANQLLIIRQEIEGSRMADFLFGTANARPGVIRLGINAPAGTYCVAIRNAALARSYVAEVAIAPGEAGTDVVKEIAFTGDTTGTWPTGDVLGWTLSFCIAAGTTYQGATGWQGVNAFATANQTNGLASTSNVFELFDVGLKMDPDATGIYGEFEVPDYGQELRDCRRYFRKYTNAVLTVGWDATSSANIGGFAFDLMRTVPSIAIISGVLLGHHGNPPTILDGPYTCGVVFQFTGSDSRSGVSTSADWTGLLSARM